MLGDTVGKLDMMSRRTVNTYALVKEQIIDTRKKERRRRTKRWEVQTGRQDRDKKDASKRGGAGDREHDPDREPEAGGEGTEEEAQSQPCLETWGDSNLCPHSPQAQHRGDGSRDRQVKTARLTQRCACPESQPYL